MHELVIGVQICTSHTFINKVFKRLRRLPAHLHADIDKYRDNTRVLADGTLTHRAHTAVDQYLRERILCGLTLLHLVSTMDRLDEILR